jgi:hypothetical protein
MNNQLEEVIRLLDEVSHSLTAGRIEQVTSDLAEASNILDRCLFTAAPYEQPGNSVVTAIVSAEPVQFERAQGVTAAA